MDHIDSLLVQDREVASSKNEKAHVQNGPINQTNLAPDYTATAPKKLSTARLSAYWRVMMYKRVADGH
jgi:hypothetical protein